MADKPVTPLGKMTAQEASDLERRMQTEDPAKVILPGGKTLKEVQEQAAKDEEERKQAAREAETKRTAEQAPNLPDVDVSLTSDGNILTAPVASGEEKPIPAPPPAPKPVVTPTPTE